MSRPSFDPYDPANLAFHDSPLERSYEASKRQFWNDTEVLDRLIARHGPPRVPAGKRGALAAILSAVYHGEIVAMHVSAELLALVPSLEAQKVLAAQVVEEAKHVTAFQRYAREANLRLPRVDPWARRLLESIRRGRDPAMKLLGMQLLVENVAHAIFRSLCETVDEPVLKGLLEYIDRDEVKHVGLARNYLPELLARVPLRDLPRAWATQAFWSACLLTATRRNRAHAEALGIDVNAHSKRQSREISRVVASFGLRARLPVAALPDAWSDWLLDRVLPPRPCSS